MSQTIDERVVSMQFDNKQFESNVQTSLSTLDKLKRSLHLEGASKGLENVNSAAKKVDMSGLASGVETVHAKFSALQVMGVTALANITNSAVNAGMRMAKALTLDPIITGFREYETQMNAVQTILANTQSKGSTLKDVNAALDELNTYADKTIYNFTEMTRNIGTFTAAGVDLDTSVSAIQGIANLAAVSGSNSQQASTAMYQLSQALASGTVKLMDWNSVVNAGMGGQIFQDALKETSKLLGTGAEAAIKAEGSFRESLKQGWLTSEVLTETLKKFTTSGANERVAEYTGLSQKAVEAALKEAKARYGEADAIDKASEALAKKSGKNAKEIADTLKFAQTAEDAATKVKTFTQLFDVMKEAAQSGWAKTWKIIIGDFEEAKALLSPLADFLTGFINKISDYRNTILEMALNNPFSKMLDKLKEVSKTTSKAAKSMKDLGDIVNRVIRGDFGNQWDNGDRNYRAKLVEKEGYEYAKVQNLVNEKLGSSVRLKEKSAEAQSELNKQTAKGVDEIVKLSDAELKKLGFDAEEIKMLRAMDEEAKKSGKSLDEMIADMEKMDGRTLLIDSFKNAGQGLAAILKAIGNAWTEIFPPENTAIKLYNFIKGMNDFSKHLVVGEDTADNLKRTLKGLFAIIDMIFTIVGGPIKIAFKILNQLLGAFDLNILDVTAAIGDVLVRFNEWLDSALDFSGIFKKIAPYITKAAKATRDWFVSLKDSEVVKKIASYLKSAAIAVKDWFVGLKDTGLIQRFISYLKNSGSAIKDWFKGLKEAENIPKYIIQGLANGLKNGVSAVWDAITTLATGIITKIKDVLGIHSPSVVFMAIGGFIIAGLILGLQNGFPQVWETIKGFAAKLVEFVKGLDFGALFAAAIAAGALTVAYKISDALQSLAAPLDGLGSFLEDTGDGLKIALKGLKKTFKGLGKMFSGIGLKFAGEGIKSIAIAIAILAASVLVLAKMDDHGKLWSAVAIVGALAGVISGIAIAVGKINAGEKLSIAAFAVAVISISLSLLIMAAAVRKLADMKWEKWARGMGGVILLAGVLVGLMAATRLLAGNLLSPQMKGFKTANFGKILRGIAEALLIMVIVAKIAGSMDPQELFMGTVAVLAFSGILVGLMAATKLIGGKNAAQILTIGKTISKVATALLLIGITARIAGGMDPQELFVGTLALVAFSGIIVGLMAATRLASGKDLSKLGPVLISVAGALMLMTITAAIAGNMDPLTLVKGAAAIAVFSGIIVGLMAATKLVSGKDLTKVGTTILLVSLAIGIMAGVSALLGLLSVENLTKGITAVSILSIMMAGLIAATKNAQSCVGNIVAITVAIAVLTVAVIALSFIDPVKLGVATVAMSMLMGLFAIIIKVAGTAQKAMGNIIAMTVCVAALAGIIYLLAQLNPEAALSATASLSILLLAVSASLVIVSQVGKNAMGALKGVLLLTAMALPLLAFVGILALMSNVQNAIPNAIALTVLATAMSLLLIPLSLVGAAGMTALIGVLMLTTMALPLLAFVGVLALMQNIQNATANAQMLTQMISAMTACLVVLAVVGPLAMSGVGAMFALVGLMAVVGILVTAVGALMDKFPALETFLDKGIPILEKLAYAIGSFIGNFAAGLTAGLPQMGTNLSDFMTNLQPFIDGASSLDASSMDGVKALVGVIMALTGANLLESLTSWLTGGSSLTKFGEEIAAFAPYLKRYADTVSGIDASSIEASAAAAKALTEVANAIPNEGGLVALFAGENSIAKFASELPLLGSGLLGFSNSVAGINAEAVKGAADAAKALAEMANTIPNQGGMAAWFAGENSVATFGAQLPLLGLGLKMFSTSVAGIDAESVKAASEAAKSLAEMANTIPNEGGVAAWFAGENSISSFAGKLGTLGKGIAAFSEATTGVTPDTVTAAANAAKSLAEMADTIPNQDGVAAWFAGDNSITAFAGELGTLGAGIAAFSVATANITPDTVTAAANAAKSLAEMTNTIPNEGGMKAWFSGESGVAKFAENLPKLGDGLSKFSASVEGVEPDKITAAANAAKTLADMAEKAPSDTDDLIDFGEGLGTFGSKLKTYFTNLGGISAEALDASSKAISSVQTLAGGLNTNNLTTASDAMDKLVEAVKKMASINESTTSGFSKALSALGKAGIDALIKAFTDADAKLKAAGEKAIKAIVTGAKGQENTMKTAFTTVVSNCVTAIGTKVSSFEGAGKDLGSGLVRGIKAKEQAAYDAGFALGQKAVQGEKDGQESNSPSKATTRAGKWLGEGLIIGMQRMNNAVYNSGAKLGRTATSTISDAVSRISSAINSDVDSQPTIRPVLDLSDVRSGAAAIGGMLSGNRTLSVNTRTVGSVSAAMANYQNGSNSRDLLSAVKGLRKDIAAMPRESITIGGITYDDGSNINDAVRTLVRAARVERRV